MVQYWIAIKMLTLLTYNDLYKSVIKNIRCFKISFKANLFVFVDGKNLGHSENDNSNLKGYVRKIMLFCFVFKKVKLFQDFFFSLTLFLLLK